MELSGPQREQLTEALIDAFTPESLERMVSFRLNEKLENIVLRRGLGFRHVVFKLIQWFESEGRIEELITAAYEYVPGNKLLKSFVVQFTRLPAPGSVLDEVALYPPKKRLSIEQQARLYLERLSATFTPRRLAITIAGVLAVVMVLSWVLLPPQILPSKCSLTQRGIFAGAVTEESTFLGSVPGDTSSLTRSAELSRGECLTAVGRSADAHWIYVRLSDYRVGWVKATSVNWAGDTGKLPPLAVVKMVYSPEKQAWLEPLVQQYNEGRHRTTWGSTIVIEPILMNSPASASALVAGRVKPTVWSPASSLYIPVVNSNWRQSHSTDLIDGTPSDLVLSPIVIAMWRPMAEALGWPDKPIGWAGIKQLATSDEGWEAYGHSEWGTFKLGHLHPRYSASGLAAIVAQVYAGANKQQGLLSSDLDDPAAADLMHGIRDSVTHLERNTGPFPPDQFYLGRSFLSAVVVDEEWVIRRNKSLAAGTVNPELSVVAIYPEEGTFWSNHPYAILDATWVTDDQKEAAEHFEAFLLSAPQQQKATELGFRSADATIPLNSVLDLQYGVDITQPEIILEVPSADIIIGIQELWQRPVDLCLVIDTSDSMDGEKMAAARESIFTLMNLLGDRDRLQIILFSDELITLTPLSPLGEKRDEVSRLVSDIIGEGYTRLYDALKMAYDEMKAPSDPEHTRAIVVLSDGLDNDSDTNLYEIGAYIRGTRTDTDSDIRFFAIAYGTDAGRQLLAVLTETAGGKQFDSGPSTIDEVLIEIAASLY